MSCCLVYHDKEPQFGFGSQERTWPDDYDFVAVAYVKTPDEAFALTNHIENSWTENEKVQSLKPGPRSTSVGDVVMGPTGEIFLCCNAGWKCLGNGQKKVVIPPETARTIN